MFQEEGLFFLFKIFVFHDGIIRKELLCIYLHIQLRIYVYFTQILTAVVQENGLYFK